MFGIVMLCQGFVQSYGGLLATRFLLGFAEAGVFPGCELLFCHRRRITCPHYRIAGELKYRSTRSHKQHLLVLGTNTDWEAQAST